MKNEKSMIDIYCNHVERLLSDLEASKKEAVRLREAVEKIEFEAWTNDGVHHNSELFKSILEARKI